MSTVDRDDIEEELDEVLRATRHSRRIDAVKLLGGGAAGFGLWAAILWGMNPASRDGINRVILYTAAFGSLGVGVLLSLFAAALFAHSFVLSADTPKE